MKETNKGNKMNEKRNIATRAKVKVANTPKGNIVIFDSYEEAIKLIQDVEIALWGATNTPD